MPVLDDGGVVAVTSRLLLLVLMTVVSAVAGAFILFRMAVP